MGGLDKAKDSVEPKDTKSLPPAWLMEKLAAIEHERWADWQKWCHQVLWDKIPSDVMQDWVYPILTRWDKQIETPYNKLTEAEKQSDQDQVMRYWPLLQDYVNDLASNNPEATAELSNPPKDMNTSKSLKDMYVEIHFKENSIPSIIAGKLTDKSIAAIVEAVEGLIPPKHGSYSHIDSDNQAKGWNQCRDKMLQAIKEWQNHGE